MKTRDKIASLVLAGWRGNPNGKYGTYADAAEEAYRYADAMIEASGESRQERAKGLLVLVGENVVAAIVGSFAFGYWQHDWRAGLAFLCFLAVMAPEVK